MAFLRRLLEVFRDAFRLWWLAPLIPLIAVVPEFVQHVAEIRLGMFESREMATALANDPTRWAFGYAKLAGYMVAILAAIRFWAARRQGLKWYSRKGIAWRVLAIAVAANIGVALMGEGLNYLLGDLSETAEAVFTGLFTLVTMPVAVMLVAALAGDHEATLARLYRHGWGAALRILIFSAAVLVPLMLLHGYNHTLAIGAQSALVWALMVFDALVVGLLAAAWGTAIEHGYRPLNDGAKAPGTDDPNAAAA